MLCWQHLIQPWDETPEFLETWTASHMPLTLNKWYTQCKEAYILRKLPRCTSDGRCWSISRLRIKILLEKMQARRCQSGTKQVNARHTAESLIQHQVRLKSMGLHLVMDCVPGLWQGLCRQVPSLAPSDPTAAAQSQLHPAESFLPRSGCHSWAQWSLGVPSYSGYSIIPWFTSVRSVPEGNFQMRFQETWLDPVLY